MPRAMLPFAFTLFLFSIIITNVPDFPIELDFPFLTLCISFVLAILSCVYIFLICRLTSTRHNPKPQQQKHDIILERIITNTLNTHTDTPTATPIPLTNSFPMYQGETPYIQETFANEHTQHAFQTNFAISLVWVGSFQIAFVMFDMLSWPYLLTLLILLSAIMLQFTSNPAPTEIIITSHRIVFIYSQFCDSLQFSESILLKDIQEIHVTKLPSTRRHLEVNDATQQHDIHNHTNPSEFFENNSLHSLTLFIKTNNNTSINNNTTLPHTQDQSTSTSTSPPASRTISHIPHLSNIAQIIYTHHHPNHTTTETHTIDQYKNKTTAILWWAVRWGGAVFVFVVLSSLAIAINEKVAPLCIASISFSAAVFVIGHVNMMRACEQGGSKGVFVANQNGVDWEM